jgi:hypothetical protein
MNLIGKIFKGKEALTLPHESPATAFYGKKQINLSVFLHSRMGFLC